MPSDGPNHVDAGDAMAPSVGAMSAEVSAADDASDATVVALADDLAYTLTAEQALERYAAARRRVPSLRTMQRYCIEGRVAAQKIRTTYGSEWLINADSLANFIEKEPVVASDAENHEVAPSAMPRAASLWKIEPATSASDDASVADTAELATPVGEQRRLSDVLIENAKLVAKVEGRDAIIAELKEDRNFLREEVREARRTRDDVKNIAERMLDTLKTMAIGRLAPNSPPTGPIEAEVIHRESTEG